MKRGVWQGRSFRSSLLLFALGFMTVLLVALEVPLGVMIDHARMSTFRSRMLGEAGELSGQVSDPVGRVAGVVSEAPHPGQDLDAAVRATVAATGARVLVVDLAHRVVADSAGRLPAGSTVSPDDPVEEILSSTAAEALRVVGEANGRLSVALPVQEAGRVVGAVRLDAPLGHERRTVHLIWVALGAVGLLVLAAGSALAGWLAMSLARPVERLEAAARSLGAGDLAARAEEEGPLELASLAASFNSMADDLAAALRAQRDFAANASHQLRTPLTALRLRLEAIGQPGVDAGDEARLAMREVGRLNRLMADLLGLARATAPAPGGSLVDLGEVAERVVERWAETVARSGRTIALDRQAPASVVADPDEVEHMLDNLVDNAMRYSPPGARIGVMAAGTLLAVADTGVGPTGVDRERVFERFYRGAQGRQAGPGTGLGLPIVVELARRWHARVRLAGPPTRFEIAFPVPSAVGHNGRPARPTASPAAPPKPAARRPEPVAKRVPARHPGRPAGQRTARPSAQRPARPAGQRPAAKRAATASTRGTRRARSGTTGSTTPS
ncbi:MAG TPA: HAMP domain-containing sensor histidine kinase [Acidimicrobiales bacterium]|nr:HAMP domain-containing sensor histidine kinase [Acidimicrobiales bacterium]